MYTCGLTVYARGHIGNFRTFVSLDVLRRALKYQEGLRHPPRHELHGRRRQDHRGLAGSGDVAARLHGSVTSRRFARTRRRWASSQSRRLPRATDEANLRAMAVNDHVARRARPHVHVGRVGLLPHRDAFRRTANSPGSITRGSRPGRASTPIPTPSRTRATSCCGRRPNRASRPGTSGAARAVPAGTSSARRWRCACWESRRSTFTAAASI